LNKKSEHFSLILKSSVPEV